MKKMLTAAAALVLAFSLASCAASQPETAPPSVKPAETAEPTAAPVHLEAPPASAEAEPVEPPALVIDDVQPMAFSATLDPPDYSGVFEIRDAGRGYSAGTATGPRFLLTHAMSFGSPTAPGNGWQELHEGDRIEALGSVWRITERVEAPKSWPTDNPALVKRTVGADAGTLVLITCVPGWTKATSNLILIAEEAP